jgi:hypothetical protein
MTHRHALAAALAAAFILVPLAGPGPAQQDVPKIQHEVAVSNVEIPVRVYKGSVFVDSLTAADFEVYDNGVLQPVEAVYLKRKNAVSPRVESPSPQGPSGARVFVLLFEMFEWQPEIDKALDTFFGRVFQPGDSLIVITPMKSYRLTQAAVRTMAPAKVKAQLRGRIRADILMGASEYRSIIDSMIRAISLAPDSVLEIPLEEKLRLYSEYLNRLEALRWVSQDGLVNFAATLKGMEGSKHVFIFYQMERVPQFSPKIQTVKEAESASDIPLQFKILDAFQFFKREAGFNVETVKKAFADSTVSVHFLYLTKKPALNNSVEHFQSALSPSEIKMVERSEDLFNAFDTVAMATGGTSTASADAGIAFAQAADAAESFYLVYIRPRGVKLDESFHELKVVVKGEGYRVTHRAGYFAK